MREPLRQQQEFCVYAAAPVVTAPAGKPYLSSRADSSAAGTFPDTDMDWALHKGGFNPYSHHTLPQSAGISFARNGSGVGAMAR
jgi:hypothetical protein